MMISFRLDSQEASLAEPLIERTEASLRRGSCPVWVSDGLDAYGDAIRKRHCILQKYPRTGKRGRPRRPKLVAYPELRYGQVVKERDERHRVTGIFKRSIFGDVPLETISTVYVERHNLTLRQENRRLSRKTIAFSKKLEGLKSQLTIYQGYFNFVRPHHGLRIRMPVQECHLQKWQPRTPALAAGLTDHIWSFKEFMRKKMFINY